MFFVFCNSVEKFCISWAFPLIECVAVWALKPPVPHTDALKTHVSQSFLLIYWNSKRPVTITWCDPTHLRNSGKSVAPPQPHPTGKKRSSFVERQIELLFNFGIFYGSPFVQNCCISVCTQLPVPPFSLVWFVSWVLLWHTQTGETDFFWPEHWRTLSNIPYIDNSFHRFL